MDAKCRWHSNRLEGTENFREPLGSMKGMQIRQGETLNLLVKMHCFLNHFFEFLSAAGLLQKEDSKGMHLNKHLALLILTESRQKILDFKIKCASGTLHLGV